MGTNTGKTVDMRGKKLAWGKNYSLGYLIIVMVAHSNNENQSLFLVVDIYRRDGDKLAENWVFIDLLHFWKQQGLDILQRMEKDNAYRTC